MTAVVSANAEARAAGPTGHSGVWKRLAEVLAPNARRPRLRMDLVEVAHHRSRAGEPYVVIKNRAAVRRYLRLSSREYDLLPLMDGSRTVGDLVVEYFLRHKVLAFQRVVGLVAQLEQHRFLDRPVVDMDAELRRRLGSGNRVDRWLGQLGGWLVGREIAFDGAGALVDRWYRRWGRFLFAGPARFVLATVATTGAGLFAVGLWQGSQRLLTLGDSYTLGFLFLLAVGLVATGVHELGHALTLRHVGCEVRRAGLLFYYGMPTVFVDTSDVWMAAPRARLAVSWAGPYTALVLGGVASIGAYLTHGSLAGDMLFAWALVSYLDVLVNLNPLLELDGYYLLVDALERPLLRRRALSFARGPLWRKLRRREPLSGDERLLTWFGLASGAWSLFSIWLALYLWEVRVGGVVAEVWRAEQPLPRIILALLGAALAGGVLVALLRLFRAIRPRLESRLTLLARRGQSLRRRETVAVLRSLPFMADVPEARLVETASLLHSVRVLPGDTVVRQGQVGEHFYLVKSGALDVVKDGEAVASLGPGAYFGEVALLRRVPRTATVVAQTSCELLAMRGANFRAMMAHELETFVRLQARVELRDELAQLPWLSGLGPTELDLLLTKLDAHWFEPGETLMRQGELGDRFYAIRSGQVAVEANGHRVTLLGPGEYCGEIALLMDMPRTATVRVGGDERVEAWSLARADFTDVLGQYLGLNTHLEDVGTRRLLELRAA